MPVSLFASIVEVIAVLAEDRYPPIWNDLKNMWFGAFGHAALQIRNDFWFTLRSKPESHISHEPLWLAQVARVVPAHAGDSYHYEYKGHGTEVCPASWWLAQSHWTLQSRILYPKSAPSPHCPISCLPLPTWGVHPWNFESDEGSGEFSKCWRPRAPSSPSAGLCPSPCSVWTYSDCKAVSAGLSALSHQPANTPGWYQDKNPNSSAAAARHTLFNKLEPFSETQDQTKGFCKLLPTVDNGT